jgi:hypothetical protein
MQMNPLAGGAHDKVELERLPYTGDSMIASGKGAFAGVKQISDLPQTTTRSAQKNTSRIIVNQSTICRRQFAIAKQIVREIEQLKELTDPDKQAQQAVVAAAQVEAILQQVKQHESVANSQVELTITQLKASAEAAEAERARAAAVAVTEVQATLKQVESAAEVAAATKPLLDKLNAMQQKLEQLDAIKQTQTKMEEQLQAKCICNCVVM